MSAQERWKRQYNVLMAGLSDGYEDNIARRKMLRFRYAAALERRIEAQQRHIEYLEADLKLAQQQVIESEERREFAARLEFGA